MFFQDAFKFLFEVVSKCPEAEAKVRDDTDSALIWLNGKRFQRYFFVFRHLCSGFIILHPSEQHNVSFNELCIPLMYKLVVPICHRHPEIILSMGHMKT